MFIHLRKNCIKIDFSYTKSYRILSVQIARFIITNVKYEGKQQTYFYHSSSRRTIPIFFVFASTQPIYNQAMIAARPIQWRHNSLFELCGRNFKLYFFLFVFSFRTVVVVLRFPGLLSLRRASRKKKTQTTDIVKNPIVLPGLINNACELRRLYVKFSRLGHCDPSSHNTLAPRSLSCDNGAVELKIARRRWNITPPSSYFLRKNYFHLTKI